MSKSPAFQFYAAEYLADERVQLMTLEEEGAYIRLLSYCWREGSIPADEDLLCRLCKGCDKSVIRGFISAFCASEAPERLVHRRLEEERSKQATHRQKASEGGRKGMENRWKDKTPYSPSYKSNGKGTYNPVITSDNSSSSSSSSDEEVHHTAGAKSDLFAETPPLAPTHMLDSYERAPLAMKVAWQRWETYCGENDIAMTKTIRLQEWERFKREGEKKSVAAVERSIEGRAKRGLYWTPLPTTQNANSQNNRGRVVDRNAGTSNAGIANDYDIH